MLRRIPFLKFSLAFIFGIILANTFAINQLLPCYIALIAIATAYLLVHIYIKNSVASHTKSQWLGLMSMLFLMVAGYVLHAQSLPKHIVKHVGNFTNIQAVCGTVAQSVVNHEQYASVVLDCEKIYAQDKWQQCKGKLLVTILGNKQLAVPCGDRLIVRGNLQAILNKKTLGAFDLEKYFAHQNIYQKIIVEERQWAKYGVNSGYYLRRISEQCRHYCEQIIDKNITTPNEASISKALLLGVRTAVDKDLKQAYSNAGVIHVLAVSGLHVALLFILFQFFFKRWMIYPCGEKYIPYLFLLLLWAFAFLTGLSASVVRAVVMFSFLLLAQLLGKKSNTTNTVFVSAMAMLLYHTHYLFDVGFQLSYLAVLGIVWVHPWLVQKLTFKNIVFSTIWEATSITLAAQLATAPLCIYYFHRFPTYFLPANLLIVTITNGIMYCLVALMAFSAFVPVAKVLGMVVQYLLFFTNRLVLSIDQLPMSIIQFINMNVAQTILLYLFLMGVLLLVHYKKLGYSYLCLFAAIGFSAITVANKWKMSHRKELVILSTDHVTMGYLEGSTLFLPTIPKKINKVITEKLWNYGVAKIIYKLPIHCKDTSMSVQTLHGMSMMYKPHQFLSATRVRQYQNLKLDVYATNYGGNHYIYWLQKNNKLFSTHQSQKTNLKYVTLKSNEIIIASDLTKTQQL